SERATCRDHRRRRSTQERAERRARATDDLLLPKPDATAVRPKWSRAISGACFARANDGDSELEHRVPELLRRHRCVTRRGSVVPSRSGPGWLPGGRVRSGGGKAIVG